LCTIRLDDIHTPDMLNQNSLFLILAAPACAWLCGMGLFKTLLAMVLMHRFVPGGEFFGFLGNLFSTAWFFYLMVALGGLELLMDLIPRLDLAWQRWTGHLRIAAAPVLVCLILSHEEVASQVIMALVGVALAVTSYTATTAARRAAVRGSTGGFVAPISSVTEDCMIAATLLPLTKLPPMTLLMVAFMMMAALLIIYMTRQEARETFAWLFAGRWVKPAPTDTSGQSRE
jgi:hypothetical protein